MNHFSPGALDILWLPLIPLIAVAVGAVVVLLAGVRVSDDDSEGLGWIALAFLGAALLFTLPLIGQSSGTAFAGAIAIDNYAAYFEIAVILTAAVTVLMSLEYAPDFGLAGAEYYSLLLFAALGMMLMAAASDLIVVFLGLETMSIAVYVLSGLMRQDPRSNEAAMKYFVLGAFSTGFLLYGIALVYGATATIKLAPIAAALAGAKSGNPLLLAGLGLLLVGFGFKVAAVPFHMWTPDVYEGAPTPVTAFMAVGIKLGAFAAFVRIFLVYFGAAATHWNQVLWVIAALTMTTGNLVALVQGNIKRMLAYSAIAHAGYVLVGMTAAGAQAGSAVLFYLLAYAFTNLGAFSVVAALERRGERRDAIADYRGLALTHPGLAALMVIFLLSLTGVPPLAGFVGKFYVFSAALNAGYVWLTIIAVLNSVVSAYYYLSVVVVMYMTEGEARPVAVQAQPGMVAALAVSLIGTVMIGIYPGPYMGAASSAFKSALSHTQVSSQPLKLRG